MAARTHHPAVIRVDTEHYGIVVSCHRTAGSANLSLTKLRRSLPADAIPHLVYRSIVVPCGTVVGERVRYS
jgi:hypothetical protein